MSKDKNKKNEEKLSTEEMPQEEAKETSKESSAENEEMTADETAEVDDQQKLLKELAELKDSHLRLHAEYDNYRKRTLKEKSDLIKYGSEKAISAFLEIIDDFDLAMQNFEKAETREGIAEGIDLIQHKLITTLKSLGVNEMTVIGEDFDPESHDAVAMVPATSDEQKGKVIDCIKKGYTLNDKVIRHPKVVVGQ